MYVSLNHIVRALAFCMLVLFFISCSSYNRQITDYYTRVSNSEYEKAASVLEKNRLLKAKRNRLLFLLEKGKMAHLMKDFEQSNQYFNEADLYIEDSKTSLGDIAIGTLLNPMMQTYKGEAFEKFMVHYYKALNYMYLGQLNEALVEARRISLQANALDDKIQNEKKYNSDAFSLMLQGIIYESALDYNNAFIAYRNAVNIYLENNNEYYGVAIPQQLKKDLLRTANKTGFYEEQERFENLFGITYDKSEAATGGEVVVFWENGLAPVKREQNFFFSLTKDGQGNFAFIDDGNSFNIPFDFSSGISQNDLNLSELRSMRIAFPRYEEQPIFFRNASIHYNNQQYGFEKAEDINAIAFATLKERFVKEMSVALTRLAVKKLAEAAARPKKDDKNKDEKEAVALAIQVFNFASEKADTRNWQTLPHSIYYTRIPLAKGNNEIDVNLAGPSQQSIKMQVNGNGLLQVRNICTLR